MAIWVKYEANGSGDYVPVEKWGKDHWSTFAYLETRTVDHRGIIDNRHMRCTMRLHRTFAVKNLGVWQDAARYPTILKGGEKLENHDDWSCLEDMVEAGLIEAWNTISPNHFGGAEAKVKLTEMGLVCASLLREHKANGGSFAMFDPTYKQ